MPIMSYDPRLDDAKYDDDPIVRSIKDFSQLLNVVGLDDSNLAMRSVGIYNLKNPYKARAYLASNQDTADSAGTVFKVTLNTESYDLNSNFDSTTNYRYTAPLSGYYHVSYSVLMGSSGWAAKSVYQTISYVYKNGGALITNDCYVYPNTTALSFKQVTGSDIVYLVAGDYLELYGRVDTVLGENARFGGGASNTFLSVHLLSL